MAPLDSDPPKEFLLDRIGGEPALTAAVDEFYARVVSDTTLEHFFEGITIETLKDHQRKFLRLAFTEIPTDIDVVGFLHGKHYRLFLKGLNATHFDSVAGHFVGTLQHLGVPKEMIDEAAGIVVPLRPIFEQGAEKAEKARRRASMVKEESLLSKIGGEGALTAAVDEFYERLIADLDLKPFFEGIDVEQLKEHQHKFMKMAFTKIPESIDVEKFMYEKHSRLFLMGLDETHFDAVAGHFIGTLNCLNVPQKLIDEAVSTIAPLRPIFEKGAEDAKKKEEEKKESDAQDQTLFARLGGEAAIAAAVDEFYTRLVVDKELERFFVGVPLDVLKEHQRKFMRLAFTDIPADLDVEKYMFSKHYKLFLMGLNETHFDLVAGHFIGTLEKLGVTKELVDEAVGNIAPLRPIFEKGAQKKK
mmetsp:Transcript_7907/g.16729  ORF Transcript_7907/g.16729 Transcript_7907/m.16729 type:complete len:416 (-) Transcript_7907:184-1431(-)|eukprot:CAMPEP_0183308768 /NCGR_PEP_ID=MMETSP0160_2-20130417/22450_1 /TAXON_ID=2839 ORGANISM="Odontella Sinensis, Strain Grunow 1884" /NCGR_SAMPLE_ID=MMETSP0160_2 /ASSEMBLY_ACC=CAM_ASM_000250 /LENGTH=415 /DNA_ID=CAMNT_0025472661 /DNA_START=41 /DNA_END=1288 /DNA_ORIENTATION=+